MKASSSGADTTKLPPEPPSEPRTAMSNGTVKAAPSAGTEAKLDAETATELLVTLRDVTLQLQRGRLVGVAGSVGSGKTSLLTAIMGQVRETPVVCLQSACSFWPPAIRHGNVAL